MVGERREAERRGEEDEERERKAKSEERNVTKERTRIPPLPNRLHRCSTRIPVSLRSDMEVQRANEVKGEETEGEASC